ncbi:citrate synthase [Lepidopterella palustris CBS 459.81]|uniref:Citrate synthase n=1 Tax=Lepidopterella palustris CBS 459.81 TaxID=1314670 RepID=A0A8E2J8A1_9PEZI|nr:citrate synthase [Lepidopterella palustris CBS 459.81]
MPAPVANGVETAANNGIKAGTKGAVNDFKAELGSSDYLHIFDSRTRIGHNIPINDNFVRASDLSTISAPDAQDEQRPRKLGILDPGFQHTACKESGITLIDGEKGELRFRNMLIQDLFHEYNFDITMYLLIWGSLPTAEQLQEFRNALAAAMTPPQPVVDAIKALPRDADLFSAFAVGMGAYIGCDSEMVASRHRPELTYHNNMANTDAALVRTIGYIATTVAVIYCHKRNKEFTPARLGLSLLENVLLMMGIDDTERKISKHLDRLWILYADHELSCSTAASLHVASTLTDPISCFLAAVIAGSGPLHAGAIELCYDGLGMLGTVDNVPVYIEAVKAKQFRLFGYGHRVYKARDPRVGLIEELMEANRNAIDQNPLLQVALEIDRVANTDPYFTERKLKVNVDLYGCFIYTAMGIDRDIIPGVMLISRAGGVMAHWREAMGQPIKIWRPMQKYKLSASL